MLVQKNLQTLGWRFDRLGPLPERLPHPYRYTLVTEGDGAHPHLFLEGAAQVRLLSRSMPRCHVASIRCLHPAQQLHQRRRLQRTHHLAAKTHLECQHDS